MCWDLLPNWVNGCEDEVRYVKKGTMIRAQEKSHSGKQNHSDKRHFIRHISNESHISISTLILSLHELIHHLTLHSFSLFDFILVYLIIALLRFFSSIQNQFPPLPTSSYVPLSAAFAWLRASPIYLCS